jgi:POT family proton-dependent oligopeptide transporter
VLFFVEMWERFGFYLMLALFTLFLTEHYKMTEAEASSIYGAYMFFVYVTPFFGGLLADRVLGYRRAILIGAVLLGTGYFLFAFQQNQALIIYAVGVLSIGNGLFKPNISTLVGNLYPQGDLRRDSAFNIFYMGVNLGALFSGPVGEFMRGKFGWAIAFATAGAGMMVSFITMAVFQKHLAVADKGGKSSMSQVLNIALPPEYNDKPEDEAVERLRLIALTVMCLIVMFFWMGFHQNGTSLTFWARDNTDRVLRIGSWAWEVPVGWFQSVNSVFVITLTPVMVWVMSTLRARGLEPNTPTKIGIGMLLAAVSFGIMAVASWLGGDSGKVSMVWLIACYFVITIAELFLSPMGRG